jgi:hypothetical protein
LGAAVAWAGLALTAPRAEQVAPQRVVGALLAVIERVLGPEQWTKAESVAMNKEGCEIEAAKIVAAGDMRTAECLPAEWRVAGN